MLHTGGTETTAGENKVVAQFQAVVADLDPVADPVPSGATYYITAGFSLENEAYVWVGQVPVTTNLQSHVRIGSYFKLSFACSNLVADANKI